MNRPCFGITYCSTDGWGSITVNVIHKRFTGKVAWLNSTERSLPAWLWRGWVVFTQRFTFTAKSIWVSFHVRMTRIHGFKLDPQVQPDSLVESCQRSNHKVILGRMSWTVLYIMDLCLFDHLGCSAWYTMLTPRATEAQTKQQLAFSMFHISFVFQ